MVHELGLKIWGAVLQPEANESGRDWRVSVLPKQVRHLTTVIQYTVNHQQIVRVL